MKRPMLQAAVIALVALFLGVAGAAAALVYIPDAGSAPSIYDDFNFSSTASGFWHVNPAGATATIKHGLLTLSGHSIELDRRLQTDPIETVVSIKIRAQKFHKFGFGLGAYHAGTIGIEVDDDGVKCGRGTDHGYHVDNVLAWKTPPAGKWYYVEVSVINPYPNPDVLKKLGSIDYDKLKKLTEYCSLYDSQGHLLARSHPIDPPPNTHYVGLDETYLRTWDSRNHYQIDWFYAGPPAGDPLRSVTRQTL